MQLSEQRARVPEQEGGREAIREAELLELAHVRDGRPSGNAASVAPYGEEATRDEGGGNSGGGYNSL